MEFRLFTFLMLVAAGSYAQSGKPDTADYLKHPVLPAFNILSSDSSRVFSTVNIREGRPTVFFYFSPTCDHCQALVKDMTDNMDSLKDATIFMLTFSPLYELQQFVLDRNLQRFTNLRFGKDYEYFFPAYFGTNSVPFIVVYDDHKQLVRTDIIKKITQLIRAVHQQAVH